MHLVFTTKTLIQKLREDGWNLLFEKVRSFCEKHEIDVPNLIAPYIASKGQSHHQKDPIIIENHFRVDFFFAIIDSQLQKLNDRLSSRWLQIFQYL